MRAEPGNRVWRRTLARSFGDTELDGDDRAKLDMLDQYMQGAGDAPEDGASGGDGSPARMPTRVEDVQPSGRIPAAPRLPRCSPARACAPQVDKFMEQLAAAASGGRLPDEELAGAPTSRI